MLIISCGLLLSISIYLLLEPTLIRRVFGIVLLGNAINLILLICGGIQNYYPVFLNGNHPINQLANPLPQAMILTAIVIGFGLLAYLCALLRQYYAPNQTTGAGAEDA